MANEKRPITVDDFYKITYIEDPQVSPDGKWIAYVVVNVDKLENGYKRNIWLVSTDGGKPFQLTRGSKDSQPRWSPDGKTLAFTSARNQKPQVYLLSLGGPGGEARALTSMLNGASSPAWSPDGTRIAFLSSMNADERGKEARGEEDPPPPNKFEAKQRDERKEYDEKQRFDPRLMWRIPYRVGTSFLDDRYAQVYVMPVAEDLDKDAARPRRLTDIDADHEPPEWTPDGQYLLTARTVDPQRDLPWRWTSLYRIRVEDGSIEPLTDESHADSGALPSPDGKWIAYNRQPAKNLTETIPRLTVTPTDRHEPRDLNLGLDRAITIYKWLPDSAGLIFNANSWGDTELYRVTLADGAITKLVSGTLEIESFAIGANGGVAFTSATPARLMELFWLPPGAAQPVQLTSVNQKFMDEVIIQETHELRFQAPDGQELQGWYLLPVGYEEGKTYPLAFNIHGGPHVMWGPSFRTMWHEWQFHAARGYAVFYCNPRGADGYGEKFQSAIHSAWGEVAFVDLMAGVDALLTKGFVDPARMAVTGGSYGGYMTAWVVGQTARFAAAVAQRGVYNLLSFYGTSDVPLLITNEFGAEPWENPQLLWEHSPLAHAHKIKTPLLIIHSENDFRVPIAEAEQLFAYVRLSGGTVQMVRFPRDGHELSRSGEPEHRVSRLTHMVNWFDQYCMPQGK